ncbi:mitogen-activated protein kinase kinase kinase 17-like [Lolium rigidum]|uniref:mitogen-activated protein kinase kinase kinase 17-like n=1 Tax=Lolium rigidum TaxID=89674 RepID=UPI001F5C71FF|nr:mitogen-activated protein kinase kinase kinase 17-like [Lolium rigidum]
MAITVSGQWTRLRTLGCGASGAVVSLAADGASGELFAVKSAAAADAAPLSREQGILSGLCSPNVVRCLGGAHRDDGSYHLFLELAPGGSLADEVARNGGRLGEQAIRAYTADVLRGLAYIHGQSLVHGDIKSRNIVIGADGRAKLADFGCARMVDSDRPTGGTPAFMAPEVARGEEQGPAADVWALGCSVVEMATGRAPWSDIDNVLAAVHRIGYTDAVPEVPAWLSPEAKNFLAICFARDARDRCTAAELLEHPFLALQGESKKARWVSPKSILDAAFWELESDEEGNEDEDEISGNAAERIKALACSASALPDWDSGEGWIDVLGGEQSHEPRDSPATKEPADVASRAPSKVFGCAAMPAEGVAVVSGLSSDEQLDAEEGPPFGGDILPDDRSTDRQNKVCSNPDRDVLSFEIPCNRINGIEKFRFPRTFMSHFLINPLQFLLCAGPVLINVISLNFHACLGEKQHVCFALPFNHKEFMLKFTTVKASVTQSLKHAN